MNHREQLDMFLTFVKTKKVQNILTSKLSLTSKALAMVRLLSLMMGKPAWPEADH